ncbi:type I-E CRISPR-associated endoribonuclease Cas2e [Nocardia wallacei]|uniref:type I-E CRISPR-associated endoribonuclease Cas2e n=1 Tax=Nocardia wallacei TaxID=480035 RepID=UPI00245719EC|nr:type I-E CRISPR-associated endoribonuclease Cas2e [Nocardia wallacei]
MTVIVLTAVPPGLRGHLTRWLLEISPGVFIGHISTRIRQLTWDRVIEYVADGRAIMVYTAHNEQRLEFKVHGHDWTPVDYDGLTLMQRRTVPDYTPAPRKTRTTQDTRSSSAPQLSDDTVWRRRATRRKFKPKQTE